MPELRLACSLAVLVLLAAFAPRVARILRCPTGATGGVGPGARIVGHALRRGSLRLVLVSLCTALVGCAATLGPRGFARADRDAAVAVLMRQAEAWNRGDLAAYMDGYARSPELVFTSGARVRRGFDETSTAYRTRYGGDRASMGQLTFEILAVQPVGSDGAVVLGRWRLTETPNAGSGVFSVVLERRDGRWAIIHDHTSSEPPPAP
jgi:ketosteroid isomerase-like protein